MAPTPQAHSDGSTSNLEHVCSLDIDKAPSVHRMTGIVCTLGKNVHRQNTITCLLHDNFIMRIQYLVN